MRGGDAGFIFVFLGLIILGVFALWTLQHHDDPLAFCKIRLDRMRAYKTCIEMPNCKVTADEVLTFIEWQESCPGVLK